MACVSLVGSQDPQPANMDLSWAVSILANGLRLRIVRCLSGGPSTFTQIAHYLGLDPFSQCGLLEYHLTQLKQAKVVVRTSTDYRLTDLGGRLGKFALGVGKVYGSTMRDQEGKGGAVLEGKWSVSRIGRGDMEDFLDFWIERRV